MSISNISVRLILCLGLWGIGSAVDVSFVDELRKEVAELKATTANEINTLRAENAAIRMDAEDEILLLKAETASTRKNAEDEIRTLKAETAAAIKNAENKILSLEAEIDVMKSEKTNLEKDHASKRLVLANPFAEKPAFSAGLSSHVWGIGNYQSIIFDNAFTNDLGAYSTTTGVFTAPLIGTYSFTSTIMSHSAQYLETEICLNGISLVKMYSHDTAYEQGTNSVVLALKKGDSVWVRHLKNEGVNIHGENWSTFSGFMI